MMTAERATFEPADFDDFAPGDRIQFVTSDNGYDGMGQVWRTGTVSKVTAKTITVNCDTNALGATARLRRADWNARGVQRGARAERTPYDVKHVSIVDNGLTVTALWIPDPEQAKDPRHVLKNITNRALYADVAVLATARRFYRSEGGTFSGWIVESGPQDHSEPIPNKREAMRALRHHIREYFDH